MRVIWKRPRRSDCGPSAGAQPIALEIRVYPNLRRDDDLKALRRGVDGLHVHAPTGPRPRVREAARICRRRRLRRNSLESDGAARPSHHQSVSGGADPGDLRGDRRVAALGAAGRRRDGAGTRDRRGADRGRGGRTARAICSGWRRSRTRWKRSRARATERRTTPPAATRFTSSSRGPRRPISTRSRRFCACACAAGRCCCF